MRATLLGAGAIAAALVGCGGSPVDAFADSQEEAVEAACDCPDVRTNRGVVTPEECVASFDLPTETDRDCAKAWYDRHQEVAEGPTECAVDVMEDYKNCVKNATCNGIAILDCVSALGTAIGLCPDLPSDVQAELAVCDIYAQ